MLPPIFAATACAPHFMKTVIAAPRIVATDSLYPVGRHLLRLRGLVGSLVHKFEFFRAASAIGVATNLMVAAISRRAIGIPVF